MSDEETRFFQIKYMYITFLYHFVTGQIFSSSFSYPNIVDDFKCGQVVETQTMIDDVSTMCIEPSLLSVHTHIMIKGLMQIVP